MKTIAHEKDSDCRLDSTDTCIDCGVVHGEPCATCAGRGFHRLDCDEYLINEGVNVGEIYEIAKALGLPERCTECTAPGESTSAPQSCPNSDLGCGLLGCARCHLGCCILLAVRRSDERRSVGAA